MKLETLNIWGGKIYEPLINHVERQRDEIDIFCFQEVYDSPLPKVWTRDIPEGVQPHHPLHPPRADIFKVFAGMLLEFNPYFRPACLSSDALGKVDYELNYGLAMFVRNEIRVETEGEIYVYRDGFGETLDDNTSAPRNMQYIQFEHDDRSFTIANLHGLWTGNGKGDTETRLEQSRRVKAFLDQQEGAKILVGDFNLLPDTESLGILEDGMRNLVKEYGVRSTRSEYYTKPEKFADYIVVSPEVEVVDFQVLPDQVSDHLALELEFS